MSSFFCWPLDFRIMAVHNSCLIYLMKLILVDVWEKVYSILWPISIAPQTSSRCGGRLVKRCMECLQFRSIFRSQASDHQRFVPTHGFNEKATHTGGNHVFEYISVKHLAGRWRWCTACGTPQDFSIQICLFVFCSCDLGILLRLLRSTLVWSKTMRQRDLCPWFTLIFLNTCSESEGRACPTACVSWRLTSWLAFRLAHKRCSDSFWNGVTVNGFMPPWNQAPTMFPHQAAIEAGNSHNISHFWPGVCRSLKVIHFFQALRSWHGNKRRRLLPADKVQWSRI